MDPASLGEQGNPNAVNWRLSRDNFLASNGKTDREYADIRSTVLIEGPVGQSFP